MLKKLLATGIVFAAGYVVGAIFGFRAAVVDYVEDDAEKLDKMAADIYPSPSEGEDGLPGIVKDAIEEAQDEDRENGAKGFQ